MLWMKVPPEIADVSTKSDTNMNAIMIGVAVVVIGSLIKWLGNKLNAGYSGIGKKLASQDVSLNEIKDSTKEMKWKVDLMWGEYLGLDMKKARRDYPRDKDE